MFEKLKAMFSRKKQGKEAKELAVEDKLPRRSYDGGSPVKASSAAAQRSAESASERGGASDLMHPANPFGLTNPLSPMNPISPVWHGSSYSSPSSSDCGSSSSSSSSCDSGSSSSSSCDSSSSW